VKIVTVKSFALPGVFMIRYARFRDHRGYFTEHFRKSDFQRHPDLGFMKGVEFVQCNESWSKSGTVRGLHFQWNPYQGKLVRTLSGHMVDLVMDIRKGSPNFGELIAYDMPASREADYGEWIWVPPGFAHGNFFAEDTHIEYFCTGEYSPGSEAGISPLAPDIDWSLCDPELKRLFDRIATTTTLMTDKDRNGYSLSTWRGDPNSDRFIYQSQ
jgi:dTDP-4-dehydrorhamnose 3,5-epimerase